MYRLLAALPLVALFGCPAEEVACTDIAISSVIVNVATADGADAEVVVTYSVDGADPVDCESFGDPGQFVCGYEVEGDIDIEISAEGYEPAAELVTVGRTEDGCHVRTETVDITLEPVTVE